MLNRAGLHLAANKTLADQIKDQSSQSSYAFLTVDWDVLPGAPRVISHAQIADWHTPGRFVIKSVLQNEVGPLCKCKLGMNGKIWSFGVTDADEILSIFSEPDSRWQLREGSSEELFNTKTILRVQTVSGNAVKKIVFCESHFENNAWSLVKVGELAMPGASTAKAGGFAPASRTICLCC